MGKYTVVKYIRLSVDDGITDSLSIPSQRHIIDKHIDSLDIPNAEIIELVDNGYTGLNMERPAVQELLDLVRSGGVDCICVKDFSRFSRNAMDSGYFIEQVFPLYGVRFISVGDSFDSDNYKNDTGGIDIAFKFLMHEHYSKDLSLKTKSALRIKQLNGEHASGSVPYGYMPDGKKKIEPDPETAETVRLIFKLALDGCTPAAIRDTLTQRGIPTPKERIELNRGKDITPLCRWDTQRIVRILTNEQYTGTYISGKFERKAVGSHSAVEADPSNWIVIPDNHPAIIGKEDFERVKSVAMIKGSQAVKEKAAERAAKKRVKKDGSAIGIFPLYGYIFDKEHKPKINPTAAEAIRQIYQMTIDGKAVPQICEALTQAGFPTPGEQKAMDRGEEVTTKKAWTRGAVNNILREVQYTGTAVSGRSIIAAKPADGGPKPMMPRLSPQSEWRLTPNARPAIITEGVFNAVQELLADKPKGQASVRSYLLKYIGKCGCCGRAIGYDDGVGYPLYRCKHTVSDPNAACHKMKVIASEIDEAVLAVIRKTAEVIMNTSNLDELSAKGEIGKELSDCEKRIAECGEQRQQYYERFIQREISRDEYLKLKGDCSAEIGRLDRQAAALKAEAKLKESGQTFRTLANRALSGAVPHKELVDTLIDKVLVFPDKRIEIVWKIADFTKYSRMGA